LGVYARGQEMKPVGFLFGTMIAVLLSGYCRADVSEGPGDGNTPVTLQGYLRYAALNNAGLKAAFEQWKAAVEQVPQARSLPDPKFTYGYFIREIETRVGPQNHRFGIMQVFPWFGKIEARTDVAAAGAKAARKRYEAAKLKLFFDVKEGFHEYAYLARAVEIAQENLELVRHFEEVARTKYVAAAASHPDVIRAQVELAKLDDQLKTLEDMRGPIAAKLNAVLNRRDSEMLPWPKKGQFRAVPVNRRQTIELLKAENPELQALDFELELAKSGVELAKKNFWPDLGVGIDWIETGGAVGSGVKDSGRDPIFLTFSLNLPLWRDSYKASKLQAEANVGKTLYQKTEMENTLVARAERALYDFADSDRKVALYRDILIPKAQELLSASETAYQAGTIDFLSLIDAQRELLKYELLHERAGADNAQKLAELEMLAGVELSAVDVEGAEE
jgi:cobalt-zinc-cadmium efflux system outer membrane protein